MIIISDKFNYIYVNQGVFYCIKYIDNSRLYSTSNKDKSLHNIPTSVTNKESLLKSIFKYLAVFIEKNPINTDTQTKIESFLLSQYTWWDTSKPSHSILDVDMSIFTPKFNKFLLEKRELLSSYITKTKSKSPVILKSEDPLSPKNNPCYLYKIINNLDENIIINLVLYNFLKLLTYNDGDYENINELKFAISFGNNITREYLHTLYKRSNNNISFSIWKKQNQDIVIPFENNSRLFDYLGTRILVELLTQIDLIHEEIIISKDKKDKQFKILSLNKEVAHLTSKNIYVIPLKLPMIVEPKVYHHDQLGGYLLNDVKVTEGLIIDKANYKEYSTIEKDNNIFYDMVNNLNKTPYKVNKEVLNFIIEYGIQYDIIDDINKKHEYADIKRTKRQDKIYRAHMSKITLEQTILGIAVSYVNVPNIYFPVRSDQRGRLYCEPNYFNYQSSELAKSLISFSLPGKIKRKDTTAIEYFKAYGTNCYGNGLDKKSLSKRVQWLDDNIEDVINYKNGKLLKKAKNKCLFIAFCMEYIRFEKFLHEENSLIFDTYLPIQLDATCNGFQHLALLSNETKIYQELNISSVTKRDDPKDFYTFMINKLSLLFKELCMSETVNKTDRESYSRLNNLIWDRKNIKQAIMTIPYNASLFAITQYIKDTLKKCDYTDEETKILEENDVLKKEIKDKNILKDKIKHVTNWYGMINQVIPQRLVNDRDIYLLSKSINHIINRDFPKITKLSDYLRNIATTCNTLNIPICWSLPTGLHINQSYLSTKSTAIKPFTFVKSSFKLKVSNKNKLDQSKQKIALMPNLIHSLDSASLGLLYDRFYNTHKFVNFYAIHDCFSTTSDKVESLINLLKTVYLTIYTEDGYLRKFDQGIVDSIKFHYSKDCIYDSNKRTFYIDGYNYQLYDIEEVLGKNLPTSLSRNLIKNSQYLII